SPLAGGKVPVRADGGPGCTAAVTNLAIRGIMPCTRWTPRPAYEGPRHMAAPFKAYDVRGIYGDDVTEGLAYKLGRAYVSLTGAKTVVVGRDMRPSSI